MIITVLFPCVFQAALFAAIWTYGYVDCSRFYTSRYEVESPVTWEGSYALLLFSLPFIPVHVRTIAYYVFILMSWSFTFY